MDDLENSRKKIILSYFKPMLTETSKENEMKDQRW